MAGRKQYERNDLLDAAMDLFHRQGFHGTTTAELVESLGVNRKSMYAEFGSKQELFDAVLERYDATNLAAVLAATEAPDAGIGEIRSTFEGFAAAGEGWARGRGCLLCNTAIGRTVLDPSVGDRVDAYFERLESAFRQALENARQAGQVGLDTDIDDLSAFLMTALLGIAALAKGEADPERIHAATRVVISTLDSQAP